MKENKEAFIWRRRINHNSTRRLKRKIQNDLNLLKKEVPNDMFSQIQEEVSMCEVLGEVGAET